ncbi:hypothetical protein FDF96_12210, partial [Clostridium botulinum]|nr:hypothetical protein [Clostridium botulinum]NFV20584.1 hypothetical protein [Clostridium botulinum]
MKLKEKISISLFIIIGILALSILIFIKSQKKNIDIVNKEYFDKCISNESINFIEYTDKFSFEDTLINNIIK